MQTKFDIVLLEKPDDEGLTRTNCMDMFDMLKEEEAYPIEINHPNMTSSAIGFIGKNADEQLNYSHEQLEKFVQNIINDINNENENCCYKFNNLDVYLSR